MALVVRAELEVLPENIASFLELARALQQASEGEHGTLRYEWFRSREPGRFVVLEEYADAEAAMVHNEHCAELLQKVPGVADMKLVQLHGQLNPELEAWAANVPIASVYTPLSPPT